MKQIKISCYANGQANLETTDVHIEGEHNATKIVIDYTEAGYDESQKWCDIITAEGTSLRYELGTDDEVEIEIPSNLTIAGRLKIVPFVTDGLGELKAKFIPNADVVIRQQADAGSEEAPARDDFIAQLKNELEELKNSIAAGIDSGDLEEED